MKSIDVKSGKPAMPNSCMMQTKRPVVEQMLNRSAPSFRGATHVPYSVWLQTTPASRRTVRGDPYLQRKLEMSLKFFWFDVA